jgi:hypothetical protein
MRERELRDDRPLLVGAGYSLWALAIGVSAAGGLFTVGGRSLYLRVTERRGIVQSG